MLETFFEGPPDVGDSPARSGPPAESIADGT